MTRTPNDFTPPRSSWPQRRLVPVGLAVLLGVLQPASQAGAANGPIPPGSWVYPAIQHLKTRGVMPLWAGLSRPMLPDELRRAVEDARHRTRLWILRSYDQNLLDRLAQEAGLEPGGSSVETTVSSIYGPLGLTIPSGYVTGPGWMVGVLERGSSYQASAGAVTFTLGSVSVLAGRSPIGWGMSPLGGMILSEAAGGLDQLSFKFALWPWLEVNKFVSQDVDGNSVIGTRIDVQVADNLRFGLSEAIISPTAPYAPYFFNPVPTFYDAEWLKRTQQDNFIGEADLEWVPESGLRLFGDFLADDIATPFPYFTTRATSPPSRVGAFAGFEILDLFRDWDFYLQYTVIPNWTYTPTTGTGEPGWAVQGFPTGFPLGNDFDLWYVRATRHLDPNSTVHIWASYLRKGPGTVNSVFPNTIAANDTYFLSGVVASSAILGADYSSTASGWTYAIGPWLAYTWNANHVAGATQWDWGVQFAVTYQH